MRRFILILSLIVVSFSTIDAYTATEPTVKVDCSENTVDRGVVFRKNQYLKSSDGGEIYFYTNGKCEMYYNDRCVVTCRYTVIGNEIRLLDGDSVIYKGTIRYESDRVTVRSITLAGTIYYKK